MESIINIMGVRANIHLGGGRPSFARMDSVGGGSSRHFPGSIFSGGGVVAEISAVTDPKLVFFKHVLCFARIMSTLCPNTCRQTASNWGGGGLLPPLPPLPYAYDQHSV